MLAPPRRLVTDAGGARALCPQAPFVGPIANKMLEQVFLCTECDADDPLVKKEKGHDKDRGCVVEWLTGQQLRGDRATCFCFESDPFPRDDESAEHVTMAERRFFHYRYIALLLGAKGDKKRVKLPPCVQARIKEMYGDEMGAKTKVGYKQSAD